MDSRNCYKLFLALVTMETRGWNCTGTQAWFPPEVTLNDVLRLSTSVCVFLCARVFVSCVMVALQKQKNVNNISNIIINKVIEAQNIF